MQVADVLRGQLGSLEATGTEGVSPLIETLVRLTDPADHAPVQDEATSVVWGMPGTLARAGLADRQLPLAEIVAEIMRIVSAPRARTVPAEATRGAPR